MLLSCISYLDCFMFLVLLAPQLILQAGPFTTLYHGVRSLPFLVLELPIQIVRRRYLTPQARKAPYYRHATLFQEVVVRCVKYAFAAIPPRVGRVFFAREVTLPFLRYRMMRHGYLQPPFFYKEIACAGMKGVWIAWDELQKPDIVIYYSHGGGFSMGSAYFYLEFLMTWLTVLRRAGYRNPAIFALEYTLVPDQVFPTQIQQALEGYDFVLSMVDDSSRICLSGDSAGATIMLSLLLEYGRSGDWGRKRPGLAALFSPWTTIVSPGNRNTESDYLNAESLHRYAKEYVGRAVSFNDPIASPGLCQDAAWWRRASPSQGFVCLYGSEEVFGPEIRRWSQTVCKAGCACEVEEEADAIHAWPIVAVFVCDTAAERLKGLVRMTELVTERIRPTGKEG
ncbi:hypothetical protein VTN00DRAFT_6618 [Thermoascus crustaceus]|uniref:uncharacterized protein n=1 Tax=Thermoascus crustaceus TaxID=5088 RepID=UPI003744074B